MNEIKKIAFYLPQYHPIAENNEWWGEGFTEWSNVAKAKPLFSGHYQPHIPADLGFYDLRLKETRKAQAELAEKYSVNGFCYYHYWFNGKMLLDMPLQKMLSSDEPSLPFCLCWANENWTRAWDGLDREVLIKQEYTDEDANQHIDWFVEVFKDNRYILIDGKPLLLIYRPDKILNAENMIKSWRIKCEQTGLNGIYICAVKSGFVRSSDEEVLSQGYDAIVDFQPNRQNFPPAKGVKQVIYKLLRLILPDIMYQWLKLNVSAINYIDYKKMVATWLQRSWPKNYVKLPCVFPSWDNTARRNSPTVIQNTDAKVYGEWLTAAFDRVSSYSDSEKIVFINAWNEWAEGCHLEPDIKNRCDFLEETLRVSKEYRGE